MLLVVLIATLIFIIPQKISAENNATVPVKQHDTTTAEAIKFLGGVIAAAIAVGLGSIAAGNAVQKVGAASIGAIVEKPELFGRTILYVGLAEGIAIYGIIIALLILFKI
ncbi:ATPase [bacterium]|nr:ATPase [bacterium]